MQLCFATHNEHKLKELRELLGATIELKGLTQIGCLQEIPENGSTLAQNALAKAAYVKNNFGINCFADDTGLEVEALDGTPGVFSARYAGEPADSIKNMELLLQNMMGVANRKARFRTVIALLLGEQPPRYFEGVVTGLITTRPAGKAGFGYDPIFIPDNYNITFAQMSPTEKNNISHRGKAVAKLATYLTQQTW